MVVYIKTVTNVTSNKIMALFSKERKLQKKTASIYNVFDSLLLDG